MRHTESIRERLNEARDCLFKANKYMVDLAAYAENAAEIRLWESDVKAILNELFPVTEKSTEREKANAEKCKGEFMVCYFAPDIAKFRGTAWGFINAASDFVTHTMPHRNTQNYAENNWGRIMDGHAIMDKAVKLCMAR